MMASDRGRRSLGFDGTVHDSWQLVLLHAAAAATGAVCLDGSPAGYYIERGDPTRWLVHLQGGAWCTSISDCAARARTNQGSSDTYGGFDRDEVLGSAGMSDGGGHGLFSSDPALNPDFHNCTKVYMRYCDGGSFSGDATAPAVAPDGRLIYFRGQRILDALLDSLRQGGLAAGATLIVHGCSAGGLGAILNLDRIAATLHGVSVLGVPESGLFMDLPTVAGDPLWPRTFKAVAELHNATPHRDAQCLRAHPNGEAWRCFMAQYALPHVMTPLFAVNSVHDSWQAENILAVGADCLARSPTGCSPAEATAFDGLRAAMLSNLSRGAPAFFTHNCFTHCGQLLWDHRWNQLNDGERSLRERLTRWVLHGERHQTVAPAGPASASCSPPENKPPQMSLADWRARAQSSLLDEAFALRVRSQPTPLIAGGLMLLVLVVVRPRRWMPSLL